MEWKELKIYTTHEGIEPLTNALIACGVNGFAINDPWEIEEFERNKNASWDYIGEEVYKLCGTEAYITVYLQADTFADEFASVKSAVDMVLSQKNTEYGSLEIKSSDINEEDWANNWKQYFKLLNVGKKLLIKPSWEAVENTERVVLELDPETSFGTGRHQTTQLCLEMLEEVVKNGDTVCDLGAGSGIISIAAVLLGAKSAVAVDISEDAAKTALENAVKNGISPENYLSYCGDVITDSELLAKVGEGFTLVTANIVADVLLAMKEIFAKITVKGGTLVVSGIIDDRKDEVLPAISACGFELVKTDGRDMWNAAIFKKL